MKKDKEYYLNHAFVFETTTQCLNFAEGIGVEYKLHWKFDHDFETDLYTVTFWNKL